MTSQLGEKFLQELHERFTLCHMDDTRENAHSTESGQGKYGMPLSTAQYLSSSDAHCWDVSKTSLQK